ncbi:MAG TPA: HypC/HybG/HupF family hydrogenase formation chaperone [Burkholderiales bacterium]|nr:HypC/HybG/HupF family hydrogenase formation chaperone [Burkholderiales bacterium]
MCIGVPMRVTGEGEGRAWCEGRGEYVELDMLLVGPQPVGTWVLAFQGAARRVLTEEEALQTSAALDALAAALAGETDLGRYFPDLADRAPQLPEHLWVRAK